MKNGIILLTLLNCLVYGISHGQVRPLTKHSNKDDNYTYQGRRLTILTDTVLDSKKSYFSTSEARSGFDFRLMDDGKGELNFRPLSIDRVWRGQAEGLSMEFYPNSSMPKSKGNYHNTEKEGKWYYWKEDGKLNRVEFYQNGKLKKRVNYS